MFNTGRTFSCCSVSIMGLLASTANAQDPIPQAVVSAPAEVSDDSGEIIVTAQKRSENVQSVPVAITVVSQAQLERAGVSDFTQLTKISPALGLSSGSNPQNSSISLRGIGASSFSYLTEPNVAIVIDDVPVATQSQGFTNVSDIAQVEVLRGPRARCLVRALQQA